MESYGVPGGNEEVHGYDGPIGISGRETEIGRQFIELMKRDYGMEASSDLQDFKTVNKVGFWPKFIDSKTGRRSDTAHAYVHPILDSQRNLHILTESKVVRVLFEGKKATGVEYLSK
jgi:alcohol oxidase